MRSLLYALARAIGDWNAISRGPNATARRIGRKAAGRATGRILNSLFYGRRGR